MMFSAGTSLLSCRELGSAQGFRKREKIITEKNSLHIDVVDVAFSSKYTWDSLGKRFSNKNRVDLKLVVFDNF